MMTEPSHSGKSPEEKSLDKSQNKSLFRRKKLFLKIGGLILLTAGSSLTYGWFYLQRELPSKVESALENFLNRPVKLGEIEYFVLGRLRFAETEILPIGNDTAKVSMKGLEIGYNPFILLTQGKLKIDVTAIEPDLYLQQGKSGEWLLTPFDRLDDNYPVDLNVLRWQKADATLVFQSPKGQLESPLNLQEAKGELRLNNQKNFLEFALNSQLETGKLKVQGIADLTDQITHLSIQGNQLPATGIEKFLQLPLDLKGGKINANLEIKSAYDQLPQIQGTATLNNLTVSLSQLATPITQIEGNLLFQGEQVKFDQVKGKLKDIQGIIRGNIHQQTGVDLTVTTQPTDIDKVSQALSLPTFSFPLIGEVTNLIKIQGQPTNLSILIKASTTKATQVDQFQFNHIQANLEIKNSELLINQFTALPTLGGEIQGKGIIELKSLNKGNAQSFQASDYHFDIAFRGLPTEEILQQYEQSLPLKIGSLSGKAQLTGNINQLDKLEILGKAYFTVAQGIVKVEQFFYDHQQWKAKVNLSELSLNSLPISGLEVKAKDKLQGQLIVTGNSDSVDWNNINIQGTTELTLAGGKISASQLHISQGQWWGNFTATQLNTKTLFPQVSTSLKGILQGNFTAQGELALDNILSTVQARGQGELILSDGIIQSEDFSLSQGQWKTQLKTDNLALENLIPQLPDSFKGIFSGQLNLAGNLDRMTTSLSGTGKGKIDLAEGLIAVNSLNISQGEFISQFTPVQIPLSSFSDNLEGHLEGNITLLGNLSNLEIDPKQIAAKGEVTFSQGISLINRPLTTEFKWQNQRLEIIQAKAMGLDAKGWININSDRLVNNPLSAIQSFDLEVNAEGLNINQFPLALSTKIDPNTYGGQLQFKGTIKGTMQTPSIKGDLSLANLTLPELNFEKVLEGEINTNEQAISINLIGLRDKINIELNQAYQPTEFLIQHRNLQLVGVRQENQLYVESQNLPLSLVNHYIAYQGISLPPTLSGDVSGNFIINLNNTAVIGQQVTINHPRIDWLRGDKLTGNFHYINHQIFFNNSQLAIQNSRYNFQANLSLNSPTPTIEAEIDIAQGKIEDVLQTFHLFEISDFNRGLEPPKYHKAADLFVSSAQDSSNVVAKAGLPNESLGEQLEYFKQIVEEIQQKRQEKADNLTTPPLQDLKGDITGHLSFKTSSTSGIEANFNLLGKTWKWGDWKLDTLQIDGNWQNGTLMLEPLQIQSGNSLISLAGQFAEDYQAGKLEIINVPLTPFSSFIDVPETVNLEGWVNANLELRGSRNNPLAQGKIVVENASFNQEKLQRTEGNFVYRNARLNFDIHSILGDQGESVSINGTVPYQLPFANIKPDNHDFSLQLNVKDDGLALLNLITQKQLIWGGGTGDINLAVFGKIEPKTQQIEQMDADGSIRIQQATLKSPLIPEKPLTDVNGTINLNLDHIDVEQLTGQFSGGNVSITGSLPIAENLTQEQPLTLQFNHLALNLPKIYQGGVKGQLEVTGTALKPTIGGKIHLYQGEVMLGDALIKGKNSNQVSSDSPRFNQLQLSLGENIRLNSLPILSFAATGEVILNGTLNQPRPSGQINLTRGQVNLLASQLRLTGENNTAQFDPEKGLDPYLNLNLTTSATETSQNTVRIDNSSSEINDPFTANQESLQTVRIQARIEGLASQLDQAIELSSNPQRSQREILMLLGGNLANLENESNTTIGLANLAGSAVLGPVQGEIGSALGLSEFRIFPTQIINEKERINPSQLGIAAEAGIDLTDNVSFSVLKILNTDRPPQWGIRYRLNEKILLRGSSNFDDDSRGVIEYEHRF